MDTKRNHFAKVIGRNILHEKHEYTLYAVSFNHLLVLNSKPDPVRVEMDKCKIICKNEKEVREYGFPADTAIIKTDAGEYIKVDTSMTLSDDEKEDKILEVICKCVRITPEILRKNNKYRKSEFVKARQVHMVIRNLIIRKESTATTGAIYNKDHATFLHAKKKVLNALEGYDGEFREQFRKAFKLTKEYYPKVGEKLNLKWL